MSFSYRPIVAPMLTANRENSYYANFWCGINEYVSICCVHKSTVQYKDAMYKLCDKSKHVCSYSDVCIP